MNPPKIPDIWHSFTNFIDHNRFFAAGIAASALLLAGCFLPQYDRKTADPVTGEVVDADGLQASYTRAERALQDEAATLIEEITVKTARLNSIDGDLDSLGEQYDVAIGVINKEAAGLGELVQNIGSTAELIFPGSSSAVLPALGLAGMLLGGGLGADNIRKNRKIRELKASA